MPLIDPSNVFRCDEPLAGMPTWWGNFIFRLLSPREFAVYMYLVMLMEDGMLCSPTIEQIARDLGLSSSTMVFESLNALETHGLILCARRAVRSERTRRNVYQRPSIEYTLMRLLQSGGDAIQLSEDSLQRVLGMRYEHVRDSAPEHRRDALIAVLEDVLAERKALDGAAS